MHVQSAAMNGELLFFQQSMISLQFCEEYLIAVKLKMSFLLYSYNTDRFGIYSVTVYTSYKLLKMVQFFWPTL